MIVHIRLSEDLPTRAQNRLRYQIELGIWRRKWREAEAAKDYDAMTRLEANYEMVGMP